jgi:hypothetical protein
MDCRRAVLTLLRGGTPSTHWRKGSEWRIQLAVGGVGLVVVRHVVPQHVWGTDPQPPNLGYYESNSGSRSAGDTTLGSLDLPF